MQSIFHFNNYKPFVNARIKAMPRQGRGEMAKIARELRMHPTRVSHIFNGSMNLTPEQACQICRYLGLGELESEYFMTLVQLERAGSQDLERMLRAQLQKMKQRSKELVNRLPRERMLTDEQKAVFYSSWSYSAVRLLTSIEGFRSIDSIAQELRMSREKTRAILDFLLSTGLCVEEKGRIKMGPQTTHLEGSSDLVLRHHANWRLKALQRHEGLGERELAYTAPVSIRREDQAVVREMLAEMIAKFVKMAVASDPPETLACLNIDWFEVKG